MSIIAQKNYKASTIRDIQQHITLSELYKRFPKKPYCSDDLSFGVTIRILPIALTYAYIQQNHPLFINTLVFDVDHRVVDPNTLEAVWDSADLPPPNLVAQTPESGRGHLFYFLADGVPLTDAARRKPIEFLADIQKVYTKLLKADPGYSDFICKNPFNEKWVLWELHANSYALNELASFADMSLARRSNKNTTTVDVTGLGRNCSIFEIARRWSYKNINDYWAPGGFERWLDAVTQKCESINSEFATPLFFPEIRGIAKSIAKWTWRRITPTGRQELIERTHTSEKQAERGRKARNQKEAGQASGESRRANSEQNRASAILLRASGSSYPKIAAVLGVSLSTAWEWCK